MDAKTKRHIEDYDVSDDNFLLGDILEEHDITVKQLAMATGRAAPTVYRYCSGESTIPSIVWRVLYKKTGDPRIVKLITGDVPVIEVPLLPVGKKAGDDTATFGQLINNRRKEIEFERRILNILEDGRVDKLDSKDIAELKKIFPGMIEGASRIFQAITNEYDLAVCGK